MSGTAFWGSSAFELYLADFGVASDAREHVEVAGVFEVAAHVAYGGGDCAVEFAKGGFYTPEAPGPNGGEFSSSGYRFSTFRKTPSLNCINR
jgi:hypothetical protein